MLMPSDSIENVLQPELRGRQGHLKPVHLEMPCKASLRSGGRGYTAPALRRSDAAGDDQLFTRGLTSETSKPYFGSHIGSQLR